MHIYGPNPNRKRCKIARENNPGRDVVCSLHSDLTLKETRRSGVMYRFLTGIPIQLWSVRPSRCYFREDVHDLTGLHPNLTDF